MAIQELPAYAGYRLVIPTLDVRIFSTAGRMARRVSFPFLSISLISLTHPRAFRYILLFAVIPLSQIFVTKSWKK